MQNDNLPHWLSPEDHQALATAHGDGQISASLFKHGDFSEAGFLLYGRLEDLATRGLLRFESWSGDPIQGAGEVAATFIPVERRAA